MDGWGTKRGVLSIKSAALTIARGLQVLEGTSFWYVLLRQDQYKATWCGGEPTPRQSSPLGRWHLKKQQMTRHTLCFAKSSQKVRYGHKLKSQQHARTCTADGQKTWSSHATEWMGGGRGVARGNQGISAPAYLVTSLPPSQPLHLPPGSTQPTLQRIPPPQQAGGYEQSKGSPISHASSSLPPTMQTHMLTQVSSENSFPVFKLSLPTTPQTPRPNLAPQQAAYSLMLLKSRQPIQNVPSPLHSLRRVNSDKITLCRTEKSEVIQNLSAGKQQEVRQDSVLTHANAHRLVGKPAGSVSSRAIN